MSAETDRPVTIAQLLRMKTEGEIISMITAYDHPTATLVDQAGIDVVLVGDSVGNNVLGYDSTVPVTMDEMLHHTQAVRRGLKRALLVADMPFLSYNVSNEQAIANAGRFLKEAGAEAVKLEGGAEMAPRVEALDRAGIPVMGHVGLTPQRVAQMGGYRVQGRDERAARKLLEDAHALQKAGAFSLVLEMMPWQLSQIVTERLEIPTIGIGAGPQCDGQVLVINDVLGLSEARLKLAKRYAELHDTIRQALADFHMDVKERGFPTVEENSFSLSEDVLERLDETGH